MSPLRSTMRRVKRPVLTGLTQPGAGGGFSPLSLFASGEQGLIYDLSDMSSLYVDSGRTTPVTTAGDIIGSVSDLSPNGNHGSQATAGSKPAWLTTYAEFDGADDWWQTAAIDFAGTDKITIVAAVTKSSDPEFGVIVDMSANPATNNGTFSLDSDAGGYVFRLRGNALTRFDASPFSAPTTNVASCKFNIAGASRAAEIFPRIDGVIPTLTGLNNASAGTGNFGNHVFYIGRQGGTLFPFSGRIYRLVIIGRLLSDAEIASCEAWAGAPAGIFF